MAVHSAEKVIANTVLYTAATVAQKAISFVYFWVISANVSPPVLGAYVGMLSVTSLAQIGTDLGLTPLLTREAAQHEEDAARFLRATYAIKLPLVLLTALLLWIIAPAVISLTPVEAKLLLGGTAILVFDAFTSGAYAVLRARQNVSVESRAILLFQSTVFVLGLTALFKTGDILLVMAALVTGSAVNAMYTIGHARAILGTTILPSFDRVRIRHMLSRLPAFATAGVFTKIYQQADVVLLRALSGQFAVGLYSIPAKITTALQTLVPGAFSAAIYPSMANYAATDRSRLASLTGYTVGALLLVALPTAVLLAIVTPLILAIVWSQYAEIAPAMRIMLSALPFLFLPYATGALLNALGKEARNSTNRGVMTAASVTLNLGLIPLFGVFGAAWAFLLANALLVVLDLSSVSREITLWTAEMRRLVIGASVSTLVSGAAALAVYAAYAVPASALYPTAGTQLMGLGATLGVGGIVYVAALLATRTLRRADLAFLYAAFPRRRPHVL